MPDYATSFFLRQPNADLKEFHERKGRALSNLILLHHKYLFETLKMSRKYSGFFYKISGKNNTKFLRKNLSTVLYRNLTNVFSIKLLRSAFIP